MGNLNQFSKCQIGINVQINLTYFNMEPSLCLVWNLGRFWTIWSAFLAQCFFSLFSSSFLLLGLPMVLDVFHSLLFSSVHTVMINNNYSMSALWIWGDKYPTRATRSLVIINSYSTSANGIIVLVNSQPQLFLLNSELFHFFFFFHSLMMRKFQLY